jgi:hypothetical protein
MYPPIHIIRRTAKAVKRLLTWDWCATPAIALVTVVVAAGCRDAIAPTPHALAVTPVPSHDMQALAPVTVTLPDTPLTTVYMTSYPFKEGVLVEAKITGSIGVTSDVGAIAVHANADVDYRGVADFSYSPTQCDWSAGISIAQTTVPGGCQTAYPYYTQLPGWTDTILVAGNAVVNARRGGGPGDPKYCPDGQLCHTTTGSQKVAVTPLAADLDLKGSYGTQTARTVFVPPFTHAAGYQTVTFRDAATPTSVKGISMPFQAISWGWHKTDPNAIPDTFWHSTDVNGGCPTQTLPNYTSNTCILNVKESGVLTSVTRVNGLPHTDSVCVQCSVVDSVSTLPDTVLNAQAVRTAMLELEDSTHGHDPNLDNRKEQVAAVLRNKTTGKLIVYVFTQDSSNRCWSYWRPLDPAHLPHADDSIVAYIHTHPTDSAEVYTCPDTTYQATRRPGPSRQDSIQMWTVNDNNPAYVGHSDPTWYVMSNDGVYKMDRRNSDNSHNNRAHWSKGLCAWTRFDDRDNNIFEVSH